MKTKQLNIQRKATGNGLCRTCSLADLKAFQAYYKKSNANCDYFGEVEVFWTDHDNRTKVGDFCDTYLKDLMKTGRDAKSGYYEFPSTNAVLYKEYLDAAKSIDTTKVPTYSTVPGGEYYQANSYWQIKVPYSRQKHQELLDGQQLDFEIRDLERQQAEAKAQQAEAELQTYTAQEEIKTKQNTKWIVLAVVALLVIIILKRTKK